MTDTVNVPRAQLVTLRQSLALKSLLPGEGETLIDCWIKAHDAASTDAEGLRDINTAPKDRTPILATIHSDLFPRICPGRADLARWNGQQVVVHHPGICEDGFDLGWSMSAPVGVGLGDDTWFAGWVPLASSRATEHGS